MENKKITKREYFEMIKEIAMESGRTDIVDFCNHEQELLEKKSSKSTKTKNQIANEGISQDILVALQDIGNAVTVSELQTYPTMNAYSNQKLSALLNAMFKAGTIKKETIQRKSYFSI